MKIKPIDGLEARLAASEDVEVLGERHYALDLYDCEPMMTMEIEFNKKGLPEVPAAALLKYSDELEGYYMDERITDAELVQKALEEWVRA